MVTKALWLQTKYMGTLWTRVTLHSVPMDINKDHVEAFFASYGQVEEVTCILSKAGVPSRDFAVQVILDRMKFNKIPDILMCRDRKIFVIIEGRRPHCCVAEAKDKLHKVPDGEWK